MSDVLKSFRRLLTNVQGDDYLIDYDIHVVSKFIKDNLQESVPIYVIENSDASSVRAYRTEDEAENFVDKLRELSESDISVYENLNTYDNYTVSKVDLVREVLDEL
jgi:predicted MPP superfamily phosphohydrolase